MSEIICPHCKNPITDDDALLCHFCGESLNRASSGALGQLRWGKWRMWFIAAAITIVLAVIVYFVF